MAESVQVLVGGKLVSDKAGDQFHAPTVLARIISSMRIWTEKVF